MEPATSADLATPSSRPTWDLLVRAGHWLLVGAFVTAWIAGDDDQQVHVLAGYTIAGILLVRFLWGLVGPKNARFTAFVRSPAVVLRDLRSLFRGEPEAHPGHNPAGGWMVVALLLALTVQVGSGMTLHALEEGKGPLAVGWLSAGAANLPAASLPVEHGAAQGHDDADRDHRRDEDDDQGESRHGETRALEDVAEEAHEFGADLLLLLVALHIIGVVVSSAVHKENFVRGMITGHRHRN